MAVHLTINGKAQALNLPDPDTPLVFVLRDWLGLTGTKYSCLQGLCGACTVLVNGAPVRSCQLAAQDMENTEITTIEGLSEGGTHPVQVAWMEEQVAQCGWCQPGQIMQAAGLLNASPDPTGTEILEAMEGNICRCGTAPRILRAVGRAAEIAKEQNG